MPNLLSPVASLAAALLDLALPPACAGCGEMLPGGILCEVCAQHIELIGPPCCPRCALTFEGAGGNHRCGECLTSPPPFASTAATFIYAGPVADGVRALKYGPRPERIAPLARMWREGCPELSPVDFAVAVPLHKRKLRARGFNQTVLLAKPLLRAHKLRLRHGLLLRCREGTPQAGLQGKERRQAPRGLYVVPERATRKLEGKRILLLDDVMTTGATARECARVLRAAGAAEIHIAVLARA